MKNELFYDGQFLKWKDKGLVFKITSGTQSNQIPEEQCSPDAGPVPEGNYKVSIVDQGMATIKCVPGRSTNGDTKKLSF
ncbi:MAG: hypothetical protein HPY82_17685 [Gammaproteobacteria bacterium]|nr:hypothetical protein [Gammaproteobacteria bacterium]